MKNYYKSLPLIVLTVLLFSCIKFDPIKVNKVSTDTASDITQTSANVSGTILELGDKGIDHHGFYYSTNQDPTLGTYHETDLGSKNSAGSFSSGLTGLEPGSKYYFRAYLKDIDGVVYGDIKSFIMLEIFRPDVVTSVISSITETTAQRIIERLMVTPFQLYYFVLALMVFLVN